MGVLVLTDGREQGLRSGWAAQALGQVINYEEGGVRRSVCGGIKRGGGGGGVRFYPSKKGGLKGFRHEEMGG